MQGSVFCLAMSLCRKLPLSMVRTVSLNGTIMTSSMAKGGSYMVGKMGKCLLPFSTSIFTRGVLRLLGGRSEQGAFRVGSEGVCLSGFRVRGRVFVLRAVCEED